MPSELTVLCLEKLNSEDQNIIKLAEFMGLSCNIVYLQDSEDSLIITKYLTNTVPCMAVNCETLSFVFRQTRDVEELKNLLFKRVSFLFIYGLHPGESSNIVLPLITKNAIRSVSRFNTSKYEYVVSQNLREITGKLSGITFGPINNAIDFKFNVANKHKEKNIKKIISIDKKGVFVFHKEKNCKMFLVANSKIINIDTYLEKTDNLKNYFSQFAPIMMFLRYVFKKECWHNDNLYANFIIDDALLKKNYGFLNYKKLLKSMYEHNFTTTIAFIPWNYKRTNKKIAKMFCDENDKLGICIHGCDHTQNEFGSSKIDELDFMLKLSTERMNTHKKKNSIDYEKIIVFPRGNFSIPAMRMLKQNNYLAAVNSVAYPVDSNRLKISDFLDIAIQSHENFPLFIRKYPSNKIADFAIDAFLGKPLFIVEHHDYFKNGYKKNGTFIQKINSISKQIKWKGLCDILQTIYMERNGNSDEVYCKIYSNKVFIGNKYDVKKNYIFQKKETRNVPIKNVLVNGKQIQYSINNELFKITLEMEPKEIARIDILYEDIEIAEKYKKSPLGNIKIMSRRHLSEIRDIFITKNDFLLNFSYKLQQLFKF